MNKEDFSNLDPQNFGNWPIPVKGVIIIVLCAVALFAGYWFDTQNQIADLAKVQTEENKLKKDFKKNQREAATLPKLKEQLVEIETILKNLLRKLPSDAEVDELIREISQNVLASGLNQKLFKPLYKSKKSEKGVYIKLPVELRASGNYHSFGKFISGIAAMNRIVTQHDVNIKLTKSKDSRYPLTIEMRAQIYNYLEKGAEEDGNSGNNQSKNSGKKISGKKKSKKKKKKKRKH